MKSSWHFHLVKREHEACDNLLKRERGTCRDEASKSVCITAFFSDGLISSCDAIERAVFLLLVKRCMRLRTHTHTHNLETAFDLHSSQSSHDTYLHTPIRAHTHTHQRNCPLNYLVSLGPILQKEERESKRKAEEKKGRAVRRKRQQPH